MLIVVIKNQVLHNVPSVYVLNYQALIFGRFVIAYLFVLVKNETTCFGLEISMAIFFYIIFLSSYWYHYILPFIVCLQKS